MIGGPLYDQEGIVVADCDLARGLHAKRWFDAVGHYARTDALAAPTVTLRSDPVAPRTDSIPDESAADQDRV